MGQSIFTKASNGRDHGSQKGYQAGKEEQKLHLALSVFKGEKREINKYDVGIRYLGNSFE